MEVSNSSAKITYDTSTANIQQLCRLQHVKLHPESSIPKRRCLRQNSDASDESTSTTFSDDSHASAVDCAVYAIKTLRGSRGSMEDVAVAQPNLVMLPGSCKSEPQQADPIDFYAVYDGHGGAHVAEHCARTIHRNFADSLASASGPAVTVEEALASAFDAASGTLDASTSQLSGSTAAAIAVAPDRMWTAHCGDSRIVLARRGVALELTSDHSLDREDEAARITRCGGQVVWKAGCGRVNGMLAMSRAMGDLALARYGVTGQPDVASYERSPDDQFLIIASDGLWAVMSNQEAVDLAAYSSQRSVARGKSRSSAARITASVLAKMAIQKGSRDNVSVIVVDLAAATTGRTEDGEAGAVVGAWEGSGADGMDVSGDAGGLGDEREGGRDGLEGSGQWLLRQQQSVKVLEAHLQQQEQQQQLLEQRQQQKWKEKQQLDQSQDRAANLDGASGLDGSSSAASVGQATDSSAATAGR